MTLAFELCDPGKSHSCCLFIVSIIISYGPILTVYGKKNSNLITEKIAVAKQNDQEFSGPE